MGGYINPALLDPTQFQRRNMPPLLQMPPQADLLAPQPAPPAPSSGQEPIVNLAQELQPYQDKVNSASSAYQAGLDQQSQIAYPKPGIGRTLLGWLAGQAIPQLGDQIINGPARKYAADEMASQKHLAALHNAAEDAARDMNTARETRRDTAYINYMGQRPGAPPTHQTIDVIGPDGKPHRMQLNPSSGRYDIDAGVAYEKPSAEHDTQHIEVMHGGKRHVHQFNPESKRYDIEAGEGVPPASESGGGGSFFPLMDDKGHVTGAWNPKNNNYRPVPQAAAGGFKGTPNPDRDYYTAQRQATQNLSNNMDYLLGSADEQGAMLEAETRRIMGGAPSAQAEPQVAAPDAQAPGSGDLLAPSHARTQFNQPAQGNAKRLDPGNAEHKKIAQGYLTKAGGDRNKARKLAKADGYSF